MEHCSDLNYYKFLFFCPEKLRRRASSTMDSAPRGMSAESVDDGCLHGSMCTSQVQLIQNVKMKGRLRADLRSPKANLSMPQAHYNLGFSLTMM
eukprot:scaffold8062_cov71-Cyclotella_meneghiniana.AAC.18